MSDAVEYVSLRFTGPGAEYSLCGDRQTKRPVLPVAPSAEYTYRLERQRAFSAQHKAKVKAQRDRQRIAVELQQVPAHRSVVVVR